MSWREQRHRGGGCSGNEGGEGGQTLSRTRLPGGRSTPAGWETKDIHDSGSTRNLQRYRLPRSIALRTSGSASRAEQFGVGTATLTEDGTAG